MVKICEICSKTLSNTGNLNKHLLEVHKREEIVINARDFNKYHNKCLEDNCETSYRFISDLREHLRIDHSLNIEKEVLPFTSTHEFERWYEKICEENNCEYFRRVQSTKQKKIYFYCNRSGKVEVKTDNRKRSQKRQGSCKIGSNCVSQIILTDFQPKQFHAIYYKTHYGHDMDVKHLRLPRQTRDHVAKRLAVGLSAAEILKICRENASADKVTKSDTITRKDIINIKKQYNLEEPANTNEDALIIFDEESQNLDSDINMETNDNESLMNSYEATNNTHDLDLDRQKLQSEINILQSNIDLCENSYFALISAQVIEGLKYVNSFFSREDELHSHTIEPNDSQIIFEEVTVPVLDSREEQLDETRISVLNEHDYMS